MLTELAIIAIIGFVFILACLKRSKPKPDEYNATGDNFPIYR